LNDRRINLIEEGFDVSLRISALTDSSLIARQLAPVERYIVGSPSYFEKHGVPKRPADLAGHDFMLYTLLSRPNILEMENAKGEKEQVELKGRFLCNNADAMVEMMLKGMGLVFSPDVLCHRHLKSGALVRVLEDWTVPALTLHAIYPHSRHLAAKVRAFVDFTVEKFGPGKAPWVET
ncbi:substrate binding domain-containing protein, partial [Parvibaculum sp.]